MEEQEQYTPESEPAESAEAIEVIGDEEQANESEQVEESSETTAPEEKLIPVKAVQDERRKRQEIAKEADYWRKVAIGEIAPPQSASADLVKPRPDQFNDYDEYVEALADYKARQIFRSETDNTRKLTAADIAKREESKIMAKAQKDATEAAKKYPDFNDVAARVVLPDQSLKALYQSEIGAEIAYYLGKNTAEMERIADLAPARQIMELGKLEVKLAAKTANPETKRSNKPTQVESAGNGFKPQKTNLQDLRTEAQRTGRWEKYLEAAGFVP